MALKDRLINLITPEPTDGYSMKLKPKDFPDKEPSVGTWIPKYKYIQLESIG